MTCGIVHRPFVLMIAARRKRVNNAIWPIRATANSRMAEPGTRGAAVNPKGQSGHKNGMPVGHRPGQAGQDRHRAPGQFVAPASAGTWVAASPLVIAFTEAWPRRSPHAEVPAIDLKGPRGPGLSRAKQGVFSGQRLRIILKVLQYEGFGKKRGGPWRAFGRLRFASLFQDDRGDNRDQLTGFLREFGQPSPRHRSQSRRPRSCFVLP